MDLSNVSNFASKDDFFTFLLESDTFDPGLVHGEGVAMDFDSCLARSNGENFESVWSGATQAGPDHVYAPPLPLAGYGPPPELPPPPPPVATTGFQGRGNVQVLPCYESTEYRGATYYPWTGLWESELSWSFGFGVEQQTERLYLGTYSSELAAAKARDVGLLFLIDFEEFKGRYALGTSDLQLNFPRASYTHILKRWRMDEFLGGGEDYYCGVVTTLRRKLMEDIK
ncbi:AP2/ERF domain-containing protein [Chloropicon primus]|uniref:AP2/ERF domain-containing protein n=1 Tax=Chloropicon primus TaxID=1764295 RepID=A0A5B8MND7_9CHLO|nr:hypothetical protein A3770_06p45170 [Chloropicon primus]UPR01219.1 AP2/ERF domain-containing protein [Chloropicon primus]|mmetsp:Transcript_7149/g.20830  ORF Transcript_7149/g.20830 Transcript_7149/m.20830 type:complete len:227 (-) Transcript_7149:3876-4556(-)|eukprot:QDZ21999.1 hypothetical protein A3770_06p45170 [Chloropicon primus]